jgi:hypothetical protein
MGITLAILAQSTILLDDRALGARVVFCFPRKTIVKDA